MQRSLFALVLVAIVLVVYAPVVLGGQTWDDVRYHTEIAPPRIAAADAVLHGELPLWWEGTALGVPLLGEPSHAAAYPPGWIAATPRALDVLAIVHVLWLALGVAVWARRLRASELGALVAGALIATSAIIASAAIRGALPALAHLPWLAVAASGIASASSRAARARCTIATAALLGLVALAGQLLVFSHALVLLGVVGSRRHLRWSGVATALGFAIGAVQWLPAMSEGLRLTGDPLAFSRAIDLVIPRSSPEAWLPAIYIGAPVLVLAALGKPQLRIAVFAGALLLLSFVQAEQHLATFAILAAAHAGAGFDRIAGRFAERFSRKLVLVIAALALTAAPLPLLFDTTDRAVVAEPPAWANAAITGTQVAVLEGKAQAGAPLRVFRPIMNPRDPHAIDDTQLADAIATLAGASAAKFGIGAARSDDPARNPYHDLVWRAAAATGGALLDRYGITHAILPASMASTDSSAGFRALATRGHWSLVRFPASPPAALVYEWIFVADQSTAIARMFPPGASKGLSSGLVVLSGEGAQNQDEPGPAQPCTIERWSGAAIDLRCTAETAAYAVVSSSALPGWSVEVDGRDAEWLVADVMRRAVALAPGEHRVAWRYWPGWLTVALVLCALGIAGLLALWLVYGRNSDARDPAPDPERTDVN
ncbi:MAG TPA: hypothetical protein VIV11_25755 [Kofleriaceae bacterium]